MLVFNISSYDKLMLSNIINLFSVVISVFSSYILFFSSYTFLYCLS